MPSRTAPVLIFFVCGPLALSQAFGQQAGSFARPHDAPISVHEPRAFSVANGPQAQPPSSRPVQPPANVRLASAEEPIRNQSAKQPLRLAPRSQNDRQSIRKPAPTATSALTTVAGGLGAVLGVFLVIVWCTRRLSPDGATLLPKEAVELLGRTSIAARQQAQLVRVGNKLLLVAISPAGIDTLTEITDATEVEHLLSLCRRGQPGSSSVAFRQALTQLAAEPTARSFAGPPTPSGRGAR